MNTSTTKKSNKSNGNANPNYQSLGFLLKVVLWRTCLVIIKSDEFSVVAYDVWLPPVKRATCLLPFCTYILTVHKVLFIILCCTIWCGNPEVLQDNIWI